MSNIEDYRESHVAAGKGEDYHESFEKYTYRKSMWEWEQKALDELLKDKLTASASVLDFACGTGRILKFLSQYPASVTGVDLSASMLEVSTKNLSNVEIVKGDITRNPDLFHARKFDAITAFRFFLNAQHPLRVEVLHALKPLLKEDGILVFNNHRNSSAIGVFLGKFITTLKGKMKGKDIEFNTLSERKIKEMLAETGFEIVEKRHRNVVPIVNEKTKFNVTKLKKIEDWFSRQKIFLPLSANVIYTCKLK